MRIFAPCPSLGHSLVTMLSAGCITLKRRTPRSHDRLIRGATVIINLVAKERR